MEYKQKVTTNQSLASGHIPTYGAQFVISVPSSRAFLVPIKGIPFPSSVTLWAWDLPLPYSRINILRQEQGKEILWIANKWSKNQSLRPPKGYGICQKQGYKRQYEYGVGIGKEWWEERRGRKRLIKREEREKEEGKVGERKKDKKEKKW